MFKNKKNIFIFLIIIAIGTILFFYEPKEKITAKFITANPLDLTQIKGISKYRSCVGHDYRAPGVDGKTEKTPRSMKHYIMVKKKFRGTLGKVNVFAPFDGKISKIRKEESKGDYQVWLTPNSDSRSQWQFIFFHIALDKGLNEGESFIAGQHIGTANLIYGTEPTDNFDIGLKFSRSLHQPAIDTPFKYMTQKVLKEYKKYGATLGDFIITKEYRDTHLCPVSSNQNEPDIMFFPGTRKEDYLWLRFKE